MAERVNREGCILTMSSSSCIWVRMSAMIAVILPGMFRLSKPLRSKKELQEHGQGC